MALERGEEEIIDEAMNGGRSLKYSVPTLDSNYTGSSEFDKKISLEKKTVDCDDRDKAFASKHKLRKHIAVHHLRGRENIYEWPMSIFSSHVIMRDVIILDTGVVRADALDTMVETINDKRCLINV
ncbi:hypothetical protein KIN20_015013 [Parelaphostrongylus tenuis]|uniref:Uncharacterized protein n=1 Tax=Parelaphostrongylus tenuis TaxID=148309 RepID=A0AAD5N3R3_PARTN|nr:hypothetical protein KIN20_015013 [Parelaphostrongylus tenuis]